MTMTRATKLEKQHTGEEGYRLEVEDLEAVEKVDFDRDSEQGDEIRGY